MISAVMAPDGEAGGELRVPPRPCRRPSRAVASTFDGLGTDRTGAGCSGGLRPSGRRAEDHRHRRRSHRFQLRRRASATHRAGRRNPGTRQARKPPSTTSTPRATRKNKVPDPQHQRRSGYPGRADDATGGRVSQRVRVQGGKRLCYKSSCFDAHPMVRRSGLVECPTGRRAARPVLEVEPDDVDGSPGLPTGAAHAGRRFFPEQHLHAIRSSAGCRWIRGNNSKIDRTSLLAGPPAPQLTTGGRQTAERGCLGDLRRNVGLERRIFVFMESPAAKTVRHGATLAAARGTQPPSGFLGRFIARRSARVRRRSTKRSWTQGIDAGCRGPDPDLRDDSSEVAGDRWWWPGT